MNNLTIREQHPNSPAAWTRRCVAAFAFLHVATLCPGIGLAAFASTVPSMEVERVEISVRNEALDAIRRGIGYLRSKQAPDGSWGQGYPAITALAATGLLRSPLPASTDESMAGSRAIDYLLTAVRADGGIYPESPPRMEAYNTSIVLMALIAAADPRHDETIRAARRFLIRQQADEARGFEQDSMYYGGIGYGGDGRPDLSNLQWSLEALKASRSYAPISESEMQAVDEASAAAKARLAPNSGQGLFWDKAIVFLQRCQNLSGSNDQAWASRDGGFLYNPSESKAGGHTSYGSMTYAGMKSFLYAGVSRDDPRVQAAHAWCARHYRLDQNPEMGQQGLYYYFHTMAKALNAYGDETIADSTGMGHRWREELIVRLSSLQRDDGSWVNGMGRWWENQPELVTAYSILTLEEALGRGLIEPRTGHVVPAAAPVHDPQLRQK